MIKIAIDCMGGDRGPSVTVPAALEFARIQKDVHLVLVGLEDRITAELKRLKATGHPQLSILHAPEVVTMDDSIETALRRKKKSSMREAINLVKNGEAQACVSAGNTGALMAVSRYILKTLPGVDRPAICTILPNQKDGPTYMLDLGANVDCAPEHLRQFALMGSALVAELEGKPRPTVGLLNVGEEDIKGNEVVKRTAELLREEHAAGHLNFYGNVEGNDIFEGTVDIVVCDGFVGNVTLKASEGLGRFVKNVLQSEFRRNWITMLGAFIAQKALKTISQRLNPSRYNGATLLGLPGLVFKSHGGATVYGFRSALERAHEAARQDVLGRITANIATLMPDASAMSAGSSASALTAMMAPIDMAIAAPPGSGSAVSASAPHYVQTEAKITSKQA